MLAGKVVIAPDCHVHSASTEYLAGPDHRGHGADRKGLREDEVSIPQAQDDVYLGRRLEVDSGGGEDIESVVTVEVGHRQQRGSGGRLDARADRVAERAVAAAGADEHLVRVGADLVEDAIAGEVGHERWRRRPHDRWGSLAKAGRGKAEQAAVFKRLDTRPADRL